MPTTTLSEFFLDPGKATLDDCDREPIHLSGAIQGMGALVGIDQQDGRIVAATANAPALLGCPADPFLGQPLSTLHPQLAQAIDATGEDLLRVHHVLELTFDHDGTVFEPVTHAHDGLVIVEFVPQAPVTAATIRRRLRDLSEGASRIFRAPDVATATQIVADTARTITGFARVKVYRFLPDWSGEVIAESREDHMLSYLGLHFPHTDIPKQARALYELLPYRAVVSAADDTLPIAVLPHRREAGLDLTWSILRSVSPLHTQYLRNMGVRATFSVGITLGGRLWGLIACHHDQEAMIPYDYWPLLRELGSALAARIEQEEEKETTTTLQQLRAIEGRMARAMRERGSLEAVVSDFVPVLRSLLRADGFAFQFGARTYTSGAVPPESFVRALLAWSTEYVDEGVQLCTDRLHALWPPARAHVDTACGVLVQPVLAHRVCYMVWFRGPITEKVSWAGAPMDKGADAATPLTPRASFATWVAEHRDRSLEWRPAQIEGAREVLKEILDIVASQLLLLRENASLRDFAVSAAHDITAPLRGIRIALQIMREENFSPDVVDRAMQMAESSADRLGDLTEGLLKLTSVRQTAASLVRVELPAPIEQAAQLLLTAPQDGEPGLKVVTGEALPPVLGDESLLVTVFTNLFTNSIRYRHPQRTPTVHIAARTVDGMVEVSVTDNGVGIPHDAAERVFEPLARLHRYDDVAGSGLGLAIGRRAMESMNGSVRLDTAYEQRQGARFLLRLLPA